MDNEYKPRVNKINLNGGADAALERTLRAAALPLIALDDPTVRDEAKAADVIFGLDGRRNELGVFWGRAFLRKVVNGGGTCKMKFIVFTYDERNNSLEILAAAVTVIKGACSYRAND